MGGESSGVSVCLKMCLPSHLLHSLAWYVELWDESYFLSSFIPMSDVNHPNICLLMSSTVPALSLAHVLFHLGAHFLPHRSGKVLDGTLGVSLWTETGCFCILMTFAFLLFILSLLNS